MNLMQLDDGGGWNIADNTFNGDILFRFGE